MVRKTREEAEAGAREGHLRMAAEHLRSGQMHGSAGVCVRARRSIPGTPVTMFMGNTGYM